MRSTHTYGATDEFGYNAITDIVTPRDFHATFPHLFGLDHKRLTYTRNGREVSPLDNRPGRVVKEILS